MSKSLKILLGNNTLSLLAGSETWTMTLALQLKEMGHSVTCFAPDLGYISDKLTEAGIRCIDQISANGVRPFSPYFEEKEDHEYDVIIANHHHIVDFLRIQFPKKPIISTIHGVLHFVDEGGKKVKAPEHPALESGVNQFVAVSEEVRDMLKRDYLIDAKIIRNFFDLKKLKVDDLAFPFKPKQFLINTNYMDRNDPEIQLIRDVAKHFDAKCAAIGMNFAQSTDISKALQDSDVVFGMGRSVLEGVAAGRLGIVHGRWGTGGVICKENIERLRACNFSGRDSKGRVATKEELIAMIEKYFNQETIDWGKAEMAQSYNVVFAADEYIRIARELTGEAYSRPAGKMGAVAPDTRPFKLAQ